MEPLAHSAGVEIRIEVRRDSQINADPEQLEQVVLALLSNAVQHSERDGRVYLSVDGGTLVVEDEVCSSPVRSKSGELSTRLLPAL